MRIELKDFTKMSNDQLTQEVVDNPGEGTIPNRNREGAKAELNKRLLQSITKLNKSTECYSKWLIGLTIVLGILALVQIIVAIIQH